MFGDIASVSFRGSFYQSHCVQRISCIIFYWFVFSPFAADDKQSVLLVCIPNFDLTHSCVLVNLSNLDCREIKFSTSLETTPNPALERQREIEAELEGEGSILLSQQPEADVEMSLLHHMDQDENFED